MGLVSVKLRLSVDSNSCQVNNIITQIGKFYDNIYLQDFLQQQMIKMKKYTENSRIYKAGTSEHSHRTHKKLPRSVSSWFHGTFLAYSMLSKNANFCHL